MCDVVVSPFHYAASTPPPSLPLQVMVAVKRLVEGGVTIIATIHSPTAASFELFDRLMMLCHGRMAYSGRAGRWLLHGGRGLPLMCCL